MSHEVYAFSDSEIKIIDPELELEIRFENAAPPEKEVLRHPNGEIHCERFYTKSQDGALTLHGPCRYFTADGDLLSKSWMVNGVKQGKFWLYDEKKNLISLQRFVNGAPEGKQEYFFPDGKIKTVMAYSKGILEGITLLYHPNGKVKRKIPYKKGMKEGVEQFWNGEGHLIRERFYSDDRLKKEVFYTEEDFKIEERFFHPPHPFYDRIGYHRSGKKALEKIFTGNQYAYKEFDELGNLTKHYSGTFEGGIEWIDFYLQGKVLETEEERMRGISFRAGELVKGDTP